MSQTIIVPRASPSAMARLLGLLPGIALLAGLGFLGKLTEQSIARYGKSHHVALPNIEYVLWAIVFGLIVSNTIGVPAVFRAGVATLRVLAEDRNRPAGRPLSAGRHLETGRRQPGVRSH